LHRIYWARVHKEEEAGKAECFDRRGREKSTCSNKTMIHQDNEGDTTHTESERERERRENERERERKRKMREGERERGREGENERGREGDGRREGNATELSADFPSLRSTLASSVNKSSQNWRG